MASARLAVAWIVASLVCAPPAGAAEAPATQPVEMLGHIRNEKVDESSGIVASRRHRGVYWTHNDSGGSPVIFAITRKGKSIASFRIDARNEDWEDIAADEAGNLYIGDIGNNGGRRRTIAVLRVREPDPDRDDENVRIRPDHTWTLSYPDKPFDAEALFIHQGHGYIISKHLGRGAVIYRFPLEENPNVAIRLERVVVLPIRSPVTAADLSADGRRLAVLSLAGVSVFQVNGDIRLAGQAPSQYLRFIGPQMEGCCFAPEGLIVTDEQRRMYLFRLNQ